MAATTGFPEPFCKYRNTTRIHPDAKVGDDAVIGGDISVALTNKRRFTVKHNDRHTISWGSIDPNGDSDGFESPRRPSRGSLAKLFSMHPELAMSHETPTLPTRLRRRVSFPITESEEEEDDRGGSNGSGALAAPVSSFPPADGLAIQKEHLPLVEQRRREGHRRIGSVDSDISTTSGGSEPSGSGDSDDFHGPLHARGKPRKKRGLLRLLRRVSSRGSLRRDDSF